MISYKTMQKEAIRDWAPAPMVSYSQLTLLFVKSHVFMSQSDSYGSKPSRKPAMTHLKEQLVASCTQ